MAQVKVDLRAIGVLFFPLKPLRQSGDKGILLVLLFLLLLGCRRLSDGEAKEEFELLTNESSSAEGDWNWDQREGNRTGVALEE